MATMSTLAVVVVAAAIFGWGALSARLERADLTAPIVFVAVGALLGAAVPFEGESRAQILRLLTEVTLVWVLFSDAARVAPGDLRGRCTRLRAAPRPRTAVDRRARLAGSSRDPPRRRRLARAARRG